MGELLRRSTFQMETAWREFEKAEARRNRTNRAISDFLHDPEPSFLNKGTGNSYTRREDIFLSPKEWARKVGFPNIRYTPGTAEQTVISPASPDPNVGVSVLAVVNEAPIIDQTSTTGRMTEVPVSKPALLRDIIGDVAPEVGVFVVRAKGPRLLGRIIPRPVQ